MHLCLYTNMRGDIDTTCKLNPGLASCHGATHPPGKVWLRGLRFSCFEVVFVFICFCEDFVSYQTEQKRQLFLIEVKRLDCLLMCHPLVFQILDISQIVVILMSQGQGG